MNNKTKVTILRVDDESEGWSIYGESGAAIEHDFTSENEAVEYAQDMGWERVELFNVKQNK